MSILDPQSPVGHSNSIEGIEDVGPSSAHGPQLMWQGQSMDGLGRAIWVFESW